MYINKIFRTSVFVGAERENASNVETCSCPPEYKGQFCEQCASGFTRVTPNGGPYVTCVTCQCNNHTDTCDPETGVCKDCQNNTTGMEYKINHFCLTSTEQSHDWQTCTPQISDRSTRSILACVADGLQASRFRRVAFLRREKNRTGEKTLGTRGEQTTEQTRTTYTALFCSPICSGSPYLKAAVFAG